jgi:hypothetical protein
MLHVLCAHRMTELAVEAQVTRAIAQSELEHHKTMHWRLLSKLMRDEALYSGCLRDFQGPLRMNETLHGNLMNVTLLGKSSVCTFAQYYNLVV